MFLLKPFVTLNIHFHISLVTINTCWTRSLQTTVACWRKQSLKSATGRKSGSTKWLTRQINDPYVKMAKLSNYRCRSAFKLLEIDDKYKILKPGYRIIDCGAAPGSWTQVAVERTSRSKNDPLLSMCMHTKLSDT